MLFFCEVSRQSANVGQIAQPYGMPGAVVPLLGDGPVAYSFQLSPAFWRTSMIVFTCGTGEYGRNVPDPSGNGTQAGSRLSNPVTGSCHLVTLPLSQPHPGFPPGGGPKFSGLFPENPSRVAATSSTCAPKDGVGEDVKVRSEMAYAPASAASMLVRRSDGSGPRSRRRDKATSPPLLRANQAEGGIERSAL